MNPATSTNDELFSVVLAGFSAVQVALIPFVVADSSGTGILLGEYLQISLFNTENHLQTAQGIVSRATDPITHRNWLDVAQALGSIMQYHQILCGPTGASMLYNLKRDLVGKWIFLRDFATRMPAPPAMTFQAHPILTADTDGVLFARTLSAHAEFQMQIVPFVRATYPAPLPLESFVRDQLPLLNGYIPICETLYVDSAYQKPAWRRMVGCLSTIDSAYKAWRSLPTPQMLDKLRPFVIQNWKDVRSEAARVIDTEN